MGEQGSSQGMVRQSDQLFPACILSLKRALSLDEGHS